MKILVLYHTAWIEAMLKSWQRSSQVEVAAIPLPVVDWDQTPDLKSKIAKLIVDYAAVWRPDAILDVNGAGVIPAPGERLSTVELSKTPWMEWWFDDPFIYVNKLRKEGRLEAWLNALGCPLVKNFIWDATLGKEYSEWTGKRWTHLPTATDPVLFSPEAAKQSQTSFKGATVDFLGTCYPRPEEDRSEIGEETSHAVSMRIMRPDLSYFDVFRQEPASFKELSALFAKAKRRLGGAFDPEILRVKSVCNDKTGYFRRSDVLFKIKDLFPENAVFTGDGLGPEFKPLKTKVYSHASLSACYNETELSLDLSNGQSFSGTNMRVYEIMASEGILVCDRRPDFDPEGELDGKAYFTFEKPEELLSIRAKLKADPALRSAVGKRARNVVVEAHTWLHRLPPIVSAVKELQ